MKKAVLITGASGGIGQALARKFLKEGYALFLQAHNNLSNLTAFAQENSHVHTVQADLSSFHDVENMCSNILQWCRQENYELDVLVNNAGIAHFALLQDMSEEDWDSVMNTNLKSVFACSKMILPSMIHRGHGSIINISSMWGNVGSSMEVAYSASKGGVNAFTRALGKEVAPSHIRVNAIACGVIDTPMNDLLDDETKVQLAEEIPAGRFGKPEEVADLAYFLASDASEYLNGQVITLDGAYT